DAEDRPEPTEEDEVERQPRRPAERARNQLDREQHDRRQKGDDEREQNDVSRSRAVRSEELSVLAEEVEQRLRESEAGGRKQLHAAERGLSQTDRPGDPRDPGVSDGHALSITRSRDTRGVPIR